MSFIPNTTPTPNELYNGEMKKMNETELKVVLLITRKTLGWFDPMSGERKIQDYISQSQFVEYTGQGTRALATAIQSCVVHGWIVARDKTGGLCDTPEKRARRKVWYQLGNIFTDKVSGAERKPESGAHFDTHLVHNVHSTKETLTKETILAPEEGAREVSHETKPEESFEMTKEIEKLNANTRRDMNIIALYFEEKRPDLCTKEQYQIALRRHLRAAKLLSPFTNAQILKAVNYAKQKYPEWTIETLVKLVTK